MNPCLPRPVDQKRMDEALRENPRREGEDVCSWLDRVAYAAGALTLSQADSIQEDPEAWRDRDAREALPWNDREPGGEG